MQTEVDHDLIRKIAKGDKESFGSLIALYQDKALRLAYLHTSSWEDAEEIAQDAFIKVFRKIKSFKQEAKFSTWFYRILINQCYDHLRKRRIRKAESLIHEGKDLTENIRGTENPKQDVLNAELGEAIDMAVSALPKQQRTIFILHYIEGNKLDEIAGILKMSTGGVKANLYQAREKLKVALKERENG